MTLKLSPHVLDALAKKMPLVALESTVITHGLPRPQNLELALKLEACVREHGAVPATIGIVGGVLRVGLSEAELEVLASKPADKASLWNLAALVAQGKDAGTTVATTLYAAARAGISVFATGGIGGVHPSGGSQSFDESADLAALARYSVLVVCSGAKSILDVEATLERLETYGVPVHGFRSDSLAGFYSRETPFTLPGRFETPAEAAKAFVVQRQLGLPQAMLLSNPVSQGLPQEDVARWVAQAGDEARRQGVQGKGLTPFLLSRLSELSEGKSLEVNLRLLEENARLAAAVAKEIAAAYVPLGGLTYT